MTQLYVTGIEHLGTIALVQKSASDHPYLVRNETLCCNTVIVTVIVVTVIVTVIVVIVVMWSLWSLESFGSFGVENLETVTLVTTHT